MKTIIASFSLVIASILLPVFLNVQNLVTNSFFSNGTSDWSTTCTIEINPETVYGGSDASNPVTEIDKERCINQSICIMPGVSYKLSFRAAKRIDAQTPSNPAISVRVPLYF